MANERMWIPVSVPKALLDEAKEKFEKKGFTNVSQLIQHAIRLYLKENNQ